MERTEGFEVGQQVGFTALGADLDLSSSASGESGALTVQADVNYKAGPQCLDPSTDNNNEVYGVQFTDAIAPGSGEEDNFFLVLHDYFTPANPSGDAADYTALQFTPILTFGDTSDRVRMAKRSPTSPLASNRLINRCSR